MSLSGLASMKRQWTPAPELQSKHAVRIGVTQINQLSTQAGDQPIEVHIRSLAFPDMTEAH